MQSIKITKHETLPLAFDLCTTYLWDYTIRTRYARLCDVLNALFDIEI